MDSNIDTTTVGTESIMDSQDMDEIDEEDALDDDIDEDDEAEVEALAAEGVSPLKAAS